MQEPQCAQVALLLPAQRGQEQQAEQQAREGRVAQGMCEQPVRWGREATYVPGPSTKPASPPRESEPAHSQHFHPWWRGPRASKRYGYPPPCCFK